MSKTFIVILVLEIEEGDNDNPKDNDPKEWDWEALVKEKVIGVTANQIFLVPGSKQSYRISQASDGGGNLNE